MLEWFKRLFHHHNWAVIKITERVQWSAEVQDYVTVGTTYYQTCKTCGKIRKVKL